MACRSAAGFQSQSNSTCEQHQGDRARRHMVRGHTQSKELPQTVRWSATRTRWLAPMRFRPAMARGVGVASGEGGSQRRGLCGWQRTGWHRGALHSLWLLMLPARHTLPHSHSPAPPARVDSRNTCGGTHAARVSTCVRPAVMACHAREAAPITPPPTHTQSQSHLADAAGVEAVHDGLPLVHARAAVNAHAAPPACAAHSMNQA